ncbi:MAG: T9SS type A sorting domain-containing protein [Chitinophagaceae bacterium]
MKKILFSVVSFCCLAINSFAQPATNPASLATLTANQVKSIYTGNFYTDLTNVNFNPNWGQPGFAGATTFTLSGNEMRHYPRMSYQGIDLKNGVNPAQNVSSLDTLHLDVWSSNCTSLDIFLVTEATGENKINRALTLNAWNRLKIPLSAYTALGLNLTGVKEFKFVTITPGSGANIYVDNIFFYTNNSLPTLSNFSIPAKMLGDAPFSITAPTSNSSGAFTYTSSNTNVATVTGNTITILKAGSSVITANQAAAAPYSAGSIVATLTVGVSPLSTNAPNPTKPAANVRSIFSNTYPNLSGTTFRTGWSGAGPLVDTAIAGNDIKKYSAVDFVGIELASPTDLTLADSVHISMWTPSSSSFGLKLVNTGGGASNENIVWFDGLPGTHNRAEPLQGQWNVYSLPLSLYNTLNGALRLTNRNAIFQIILVGKAPFTDNTYYIDNIYFSSSTNILPVDFKAFDINKSGKAINLNWIVANEIGLAEYVVEKSLNGKDFDRVATIAASGKERYSFADDNLVNGIIYYRIKAVDKDGKFKYSATKNVTNSDSKLEYSVYPNPAKNELVIKNLTGNNNISLVDATGRIVLRRNNVTNGLTTLNITNLQNGFYTVVVNNGVENKTMKIVVEK